MCKIPYRKTKVGKLRSIYADQKKTSKRRGYTLPDYTSDEFVEWGLGSKEFNLLYKDWADNDYYTMLAPSADRLNDYESYTFNNLRWVTYEINLNKANKDRFMGVNSKCSRGVLQYTLDGLFVKEYPSIISAGRSIGIDHSRIGKVCRGKGKTAGGFIWRFV